MSVADRNKKEQTALAGGFTSLCSDLSRAESNSKRTILIVDSSGSRRRTLLAALHGLDHQIVEAGTTAEAMSEIARRQIDAVVVDLFASGSGGVDLCRRVKAGSASATVPVFVIARRDDLESELLAIDAGADGFLTDPIHPRLLRARVQASLRHKSMRDSLDETENVLFTLAQSVEERDPALAHHCERLALMAAAIGMRLGLSPADILTLQRGGYLHDVGKVAIPDSVLLKPGPLTPEEWEVMKSHPEKGDRICSHIRSLGPVLPIIRHHHERWDGSGYPDGLKGEEIPLLARILQVADIYDALTATRPYKCACSPDEALRIMRQEAAKGWRDPQLIEVFEQVLPVFKTASSSELASASLNALAASIERYRKLPGGVPLNETQLLDTQLLDEDIKLVSGL